MQKLFLIDALNFLFRSYYAIGPMTNPKGESTNALFGFIRSIQKVIKDFSPTHLAIVFDGEDNKKQRQALYADYKIHRKKMPEDLGPQIDKAHHYCELVGLPLLSIGGVEADDTIGSIAKWAEKNGTEVFIISSDKDLCQLIDDNIFVLNPHKENLLIDKEKVKELFGVTARQIIDLLAIMGDASDNIPGIEGFGSKTATQLLEQFGTLEYLLDHPDEVPGAKKQEALKTQRAVALLSKELATIHTNVDVPKEDHFYQIKTPDLAKLKAFFQEMHFLSLLKEIDIQKDDGKTSYISIETEEELDKLFSVLAVQKEICLDTETTSIIPMQAQIVGVGLGYEPKAAYYLPWNGKLDRKHVQEKLKDLLEEKKVPIYGHNIKYDLHALANEEIFPDTVDFDTIIASYVLEPHVQKHSLDGLCMEKFGKAKIPITDLIGKGKQEITMDAVPIEKITAYCCEDVDYTVRLKKLFAKEIEKENLENVLEKIELPLIPVLFSMERKGIYVDTHFLSDLSKEIMHSLHSVEEEIYSFAEERFNLNSPKQLSHILFEKLKLKPPKKTTTGFSTSAEVLEILEGDSPIVAKILEYRTLEKLRSTYLDVLPTQIHPKTKRIHCTFNQSVAATGRLSCQNPNLQNIPIRTTEGRKIREAFRPEHPGWSFLSSDYSQIELRLLAHFSEEPLLIKAFQNDEDIHAATASEIFSVPLKDVTSEMRRQAKAVNFGILYGQQAFGLAKELGIEFKEASLFIDSYFTKYKKVKEFLEDCKDNARKTGKTFTITGRHRPIPEINSKNPALRNAAERLALNTPLQGTAADLIKLAMIDLHEILEKRTELGFMILQIHDELVFEVPDEKLEELSIIVKKVMENVFSLKVPLSVTISIGKNWGEC